ncbi:DUF1552 domain-containing protein [Rhodopirellula sp. P2]|uniref:DUF1552 domain-containing protein n=1 Tax=Rhodopirellula sp. P2 TaxID=2127060 RepID=UPI002367559F|nr:DUF1552 domain-containing protein [Rhodopirellula sp. P2]WDQ16331.1 DUF1552 domain-containing protein [Rhodopirellula sp. P2]
MKRSHLSRRTLLRGTGASVALPLLDAMIPAMTASAATAAAPSRLKRIGYIYIPMGYNPAEWTPDGETLDELPSSLSPLEEVKDHLTVISNTDLQNAYPGSHATSNSAFLSAARAKRTESSDYYNGTTVDQVAARKIGATTQLPSLELSMDLLSTVGQCDNGYACVYQNSLSWASPTQPLPSEAHPRIVFESLFGEGGTPEQRRAAMQKRASLLDSINLEIKRIKNRVGASDRNKIDGYLESIREVERRIQLAEQNSHENPLPDLDRPVGVPTAYADHAKLMFDLQLLAFQGDITRVVSFQLAREASTRTYPEIGVPDPHHPVTHHGRDPEKLAKVAKINQFHVSLFADFLKRMNEVPEGDGTLLDHSLYMYGSGMGDPDAHDHSNLPILVAGGAAENMRGNRHLRFKAPEPLSNLHLTLLNKVGVPLESFADSTGTVDDLFDPVTL